MASRKSKKPATRKRGAYVVFISHSTVDLWIASQMAKEIRNAGATPWLDELELGGGDPIRDRILRGIDACREAVVLITPQSIQSEWVSFEIGAVSMQRKRVTPILQYVPHDQLKILADIKSLDLNRFDQYLTQLKQRMRRR
ncbi:MAG: toll/interleukin-1 receptor domain-containing protein [Acidobacteriota bacterium]|nr:MAG: toll/interleukin-1 receptor domain-containing protein [Acidobacteriota bacterium]